MAEKKPVSIGIVLSNCLCAVLWNINVFMDLAYGEPDILRMICAIAWDFCAVVWILRYRKSNKKDE